MEGQRGQQGRQRGRRHVLSELSAPRRATSTAPAGERAGDSLAAGRAGGYQGGAGEDPREARSPLYQGTPTVSHTDTALHS